jgi:Mn2+/Fe2+ NRAMP family transporter
MGTPEPHQDVILTQPPPKTVGGILQKLGPGLVIAGSIVGSGELIGTTSTGAAAGFTLLWLIILGCVVKVWVQVELGRYTMVSGQTTMQAMNATPGPSLAVGQGRMNWLAMYWFLMFVSSLGQLGGIVAFVGQSLAIICPITNTDQQYNALLAERTKLALEIHHAKVVAAKHSAPAEEKDVRQARVDEIKLMLYGDAKKDIKPSMVKQNTDEKIWATIVTVLTSVLLVVGRYKTIEMLTTIMVAGFTFLSMLTVIMLQVQGEYTVGWSDLLAGLSFQLPPEVPGKASPIIIALATFGIIGVGANELIQYPYWCQEKGYARFTGRYDGSDAWVERARGWLKVLQWDAWCSMLVYSFATIAFYLLGAAVLANLRLDPDDNDMIRTLSVMYEPIFGSATAIVFLIGALAVLYSTFLVANAGHARVCADAVRVFVTPQASPQQLQRWIQFFNALFPVICLLFYVAFKAPKQLILASGAMQAIMLPMLAFTAIYFRYTSIDARVAPSKFWDVCLWISGIVMLITGSWLAYIKIMPPS